MDNEIHALVEILQCLILIVFTLRFSKIEKVLRPLFWGKAHKEEKEDNK